MIRLEMMILVVSGCSCCATHQFMAATSFRDTNFTTTNPRCTELLMIGMIGAASVFVNAKQFVLLP